MNRRQLMLRHYEAQHGLCYFCSRVMRIREHGEGKMQPDHATLEHLQDAHSPGGRIEKKFLACSCHECNRTRNDEAIRVEQKKRSSTRMREWRKRCKAQNTMGNAV